MGAGDFPAGEGPAGYDPIIQSRAGQEGEQLTALRVDGIARDNLLDDRGRYVKVHWVDAAAFDLLRIQKGSIASAPDTGETISVIKFIDHARVQAQVEDRVKLAWQMLLSRSLVRIERITVDLSVSGRIVAVVDYVNLVTGKSKQATQALT